MKDQLIDTTGLDRVIALLRRVEDLDPRPVIDEWAAIIVEDNRSGVLAGLNKDGNPYSPELKYRLGGGKSMSRGRGRTRFARTPRAGEPGGFAGVGARSRFRIKSGYFQPRKKGAQSGVANNNLTTKQYQQLSGPFAAPRRQHSRIITNFVVNAPQNVGDRWRWLVSAGWKDVVDAEGRAFYSHLFAQPGRDYRGVRPTGRQKCREAMLDWLRRWLDQAKGQV
jgi:hypothetical protein